MGRRILEQADGALEELHHGDLFTRVGICVSKDTVLRSERLLHKSRTQQRLRRASELAYPYLNLFHRGEDRQLKLAKEELLLHALSDSGVKIHAEALGRGESRDAVLEGLTPQAREYESVGRALGRVAHDEAVRDEPTPCL